MTKTKISLFAGAAVIVAGGLVLAISMNPSTSSNDGHGTIGAQQNYKAEIPMAFSVGKTQMTSGSYNFRLESSAGHPVIVVQKADGSAQAMVMPGGSSDVPKAWQNEGKPRITFNCVGVDSDRSCTLARLWNGQDGTTYNFPAPKLSKADAERVAAVEVGLNRAD